MRNLKGNRKLSRTTDPRKALLKSLASALLQREKIQTTEEKAREVSSFFEKMVTHAKKDNLATVTLLNKFFQPALTKKLIKDIAPRYKDRQGGYTRIMKLGQRKSDGAKMAIIELVK